MNKTFNVKNIALVVASVAAFVIGMMFYRKCIVK